MLVDDDPQTRDYYQTDDHQKMDAEVKNAFSPSWWEKDPSELRLFPTLQKIIKADQRLDDKFSENFEIVPQIVWTTLLEVWKTLEFRKVRILRCIQDPQKTRSRPQSPPHDVQASLAAAMADGYKGDSVNAFIQYLKSNDRSYGSTYYYGRFCSITQSSGTGKTRLLYELGNKGVCVLYINIRFREDTQGYPPRDNIPADILTADLLEEQYSTQCQAFFATVFKCLGAFLKKEIPHEMLFNHETRAGFFQDVQSEFSNVKEEILKSPNPSRITKRYSRTMVNAPCFSHTKKNIPRVVIAIDESHVLHELKRSYSLVTVLFRVIKSFSGNEPLWVVFASTVSRVVDFAAPQALFPSARVAVQGEMLFPPFTQLGWDQHAPVLKDVELDKVAWGCHLLRYGRPLWWSLKNGQDVADIVKLAGQKLCGTGTFNPHDRRHAFAVLGQRFGLDVALGHREATKYNDELTANHLHVCIKTTENRLWSYTTYPSEPVVSAAAAELLHLNKGYLETALRVVCTSINDGLVNAGDSGELASRFIWLLAKDYYVRNDHVSPSFNPYDGICDIVRDDYELPYCQLVPVVRFLKAVFGSGITDMAPGLEKTFEDAYVNFSHWIQMDFDITRGDTGEQNDVTIEEWTESLWARTGAVQCCHNQPYIDKVIPMFFKSRPRGKSMSHILISDKARGNSPLKTLENITRRKITPADYSGPPYIVILADLGVKNPPEDERFDVFDDSREESSDRCLRIYAAGLENKTYGFLDPKIAEKLSDLYARQSAPPGQFEVLEDQVRFGKSRERRYLNLKG